MEAAAQQAESVADATLIEVGDVVEVEGGITAEIGEIAVCLAPSTDPAGETSFAKVQSCEFSLPFVVDLVSAPGHWAYKNQIRRIVRKWDAAE